jgi:hypothetical protein
MESADKQVIMPVQSWTGRAERRVPPKVDYYTELMNWVQGALSEAEKNKNFNKKDQFLGLLKDLNHPSIVNAAKTTQEKE